MRIDQSSAVAAVAEHFSIETILLAGCTLLIASIVMSRISSRFGIPALLVFLLIGILAGSDGPGGIYFDNAWAAQSLGVVALRDWRANSCLY